MILNDDDRPIRIRPRKPRVARQETASWVGGYTLLMHFARGSRGAPRATGGAPLTASPARPHIQRCAVRVTHLINRSRGQWRAHGRYLARESAVESRATAAGFDRKRDGIDVASELERWQSYGDPRLWKVILSPEFGDRVDLQRLVRDLIGQMERDLGIGLEWVAVIHQNTEHPHVHLAIRGITSASLPLHFKRDVKHGIRSITEEMCTRQLGYRTSRDAAEAERREIGECRFTSLDRAILRDADKDPQQPNSSCFTIVKNPAQAGLNEAGRLHVNHMVSRLSVLQRMGLAESAGPNSWHIRYDMEEVLRAMQLASDRQRVLAAHGVPISDKRIPVQMLDLRHFTGIEGRILVHGEDEQSGRRYLMLEGTDAKVHLLYYTSEIEEARSNGELRTNSFVRIRKVIAGGQPALDIRDFGDAEQLLNNRHLLRENARDMLNRGVVPSQDGWSGWLGKYQAALAATASEILQNRERTAKSLEWRRERSRER